MGTSFTDSSVITIIATSSTIFSLVGGGDGWRCGGKCGDDVNDNDDAGDNTGDVDVDDNELEEELDDELEDDAGDDDGDENLDARLKSEALSFLSRWLRFAMVCAVWQKPGEILSCAE
jgi:hypothetical protein